MFSHQEIKNVFLLFETGDPKNYHTVFGQIFQKKKKKKKFIKKKIPDYGTDMQT